MPVRFIPLLGAALCFSCYDAKAPDQHQVFGRVDQVDHYQLNVPEKELEHIFTNENISMDERRLTEIIHHKDPRHIEDSAFVAELDATPYFTKKTFDPKFNQKVLQAFELDEPFLSASFKPVSRLCAPMYRDILVFRSNKKLTGLAKLCFECDEAHLVAETPKSKKIKTNYPELRKVLNAR